jgi:hypothetical protein
MSTLGLAIVACVLATLAAKFWASLRDFKRAEYIQNFQWPAGLLQKLEAQHAHFSRKESALVGNGLRQFFMAYLKCGQQHVAMPSQVADDLWHEFILYTRAYEDFCAKAFGGFLHHTPAVVLSPEAKRSNEGLRRVWWQCCKIENIDTISPTRLPLLFALDSKLKIPNGYVYAPDCRDLRRNGDAGSQCGGDFSDSSTDGGTDGFGDGGSSSDGSSDGGGDGGGCGGD